MVWFADVPLRVGREFTLPETVRFMYALEEFGPERRHIDGWGAFVELPAVVELLDLVAAGDLNLGDVRAALARVAAAMEARELAASEHIEGRRKFTTPETLRCFGDCPRCLRNYDTIRAHWAEADRRRSRPLDPQLYPIAVTNSTVHRPTCHTVVQSHNSWRWADLDDDTLRIEVQHYTHDGFGLPELPRALLTADEYDRWRAERTGPHGGLKYRLCKICDPEVPLA